MPFSREQVTSSRSPSSLYSSTQLVASSGRSGTTSVDVASVVGLTEGDAGSSVKIGELVGVTCARGFAGYVVAKGSGFPVAFVAGWASELNPRTPAKTRNGAIFLNINPPCGVCS